MMREKIFNNLSLHWVCWTHFPASESDICKLWERSCCQQARNTPLLSASRGGGGEPRGAVDGPAPRGRKGSTSTTPHPQRGSHLGRPPPPSSARGAHAWAVLGEPAPAWGPLTASPVEYCISWL